MLVCGNKTVASTERTETARAAAFPARQRATRNRQTHLKGLVRGRTAYIIPSNVRRKGWPARFVC
jgi:hypothetical protein